jgi:antitoxin HicB
MANFSYPVTIVADDNGTFVVDVIDFSEAHSFGETEDEALMWAEDCLEEVVYGRMALRQQIPLPSAARRRKSVTLPAMTAARVVLYRLVQQRKLSNAQLARRLGWDIARVARLFDGRYRPRVDDLETALRALGKRLVIDLADAA